MSHFKNNSKFILGAFFSLILALYPICVYFGLNYFEPGYIGLCLLGVIALRFWFVKKRANDAVGGSFMWAIYAGALIALITFIMNDKISLMVYPVVINLVLFLVFLLSVLNPPTLIERFARMQHELSPAAVVYTRRVTIAWCLFFVFNGAVSAYTAFFTSLEVWTLYNGLISYLLIGLFFGIEFLIRIRKKRH